MKKRKRRAKNSNDEEPILDMPPGWKKKSIFFQLPYWTALKIRHNLDVMHIEKNVCDNIFATLLQDPKKSKDDIRARLDLGALEIRKSLQAIDLGNEKYEIPPSIFSMSRYEMQIFFQVLKSVKSPDGYFSNISNYVQVNERKIVGLKTQDCHVLFHQLLPVAMRDNFNLEVAKVLIEFCGFLYQLCSKVIDIAKFDKLKNQVVKILCKLEMIFPLSFFTVMVNLRVHLVIETNVKGLVTFCWTLPIERSLVSNFA